MFYAEVHYSTVTYIIDNPGLARPNASAANSLRTALTSIPGDMSLLCLISIPIIVFSGSVFVSQRTPLAPLVELQRVQFKELEPAAPQRKQPGRSQMPSYRQQ